MIVLNYHLFLFGSGFYSRRDGTRGLGMVKNNMSYCFATSRMDAINDPRKNSGIFCHALASLKNVTGGYL